MRQRFKEQENGSATQDDIWNRRGQSRLFPCITWPRPAAKKSSPSLRPRARQAIVLSPEESRLRRGRNLRRSAALRRALQETRRRDRRHHRHAAQLRRRARHRRRHPPLRTQGSGAGAGHARPLRRHDHRHAPRQLLRQDERLQQHDAVRHSVLAHHAAHGSAQLARIQGRPRMVLRRSAAS